MRLVIIGLLCAVLGALGVTTAFSQAHKTTGVVAMARQVMRGQTITEADLTTLTVGTLPGISTVPADRLHDLVGRTALVDLPARSLVAEGSVGDPAVGTGLAHVGLKLAAGRLPVAVLPPGTKVILVEVAGRDSDAGAAEAVSRGRSFAAHVVTSPEGLPDGAHWVLDVSVTSSDAATVASLAAAERLALVRGA